MPRIFHVTFTREFEATIVAETETELRQALEAQEHEFDDWADSDDWEVHITDPLAVKDPDRIPTSVWVDPDMGVDDSGECVNILDYQVDHPEYKAEVEQEVKDVIRRLTIEKHNLKLPFGG